MSEKQKLVDLAEKTQKTLFEVSSVFPFMLFPNTVRIDENKVDLIYRDFFWVEHVFSILVPNINAVHLSEGPFFANLTFEITGYETNPGPVNYLPKGKARQARRIIMGIIAATREGIDMSKISTKTIIEKTEEIGAARSASES